jgi:hypothetical protein
VIKKNVVIFAPVASRGRHLLVSTPAGATAGRLREGVEPARRRAGAAREAAAAMTARARAAPPRRRTTTTRPAVDTTRQSYRERNSWLNPLAPDDHRREDRWHRDYR